MTTPPPAPRDDVPTYAGERVKAFADAVVAIAMTLLILPLMESIADVAASDLSAEHWFAEHQQQLVSFVISFVIIAMFWVNHHRMFAPVHRVTNVLIWIVVAWLLSIVWLPVATAMSGQMDADDPLVKTVYIGSMILASLLTLAQRLYLRRHLDLGDLDRTELTRGVAVDLAMSTLFAIALVVAVAVPAVGYWALFVMWLMSPAQLLFRRMLGVRESRR